MSDNDITTLVHLKVSMRLPPLTGTPKQSYERQSAWDYTRTYVYQQSRLNANAKYEWDRVPMYFGREWTITVDANGIVTSIDVVE